MQKLPELRGSSRKLKKRISKSQVLTPSSVTVSGQLFTDAHRQRVNTKKIESFFGKFWKIFFFENFEIFFWKF